MLRWQDGVGTVALRLAGILSVVLILVQAAMTNDNIRYRLSWGEQFEGYPAVVLENQKPAVAASDSALVGEESFSPWAEIVVEVENYSSLPKAFVLVNGEKAGVFYEPRLRIRVMAGDDLEIDTSSYSSPISFRICETSRNVAEPGPGTVVSSTSGRVYLGKVMVK